MGRLPTIKPRLACGTRARLPLAAPEAVRVEARGKTAERGYDSEWQRGSVAFRKRYPACAYCWLENRAGPPQMVDHLYPHGLRRGHDTPDQRRLFRDKRYWVTSCHDCHRGFKAMVEAKGIDAIDALARRLGVDPLADDALRVVVIAALSAPGRTGYAPSKRFIAHPKGLRLNPAACELAIYFGPPAAGKSTAALDWAGDRARVIDLDWIQAELTGAPIRQSGERMFAGAMRERNRRLMALSRASGPWAFVIGAPKRAERDEWIESLKPVRAVLLLPDRDVLAERMLNDPSRDGARDQQRWIVYKWFEEYQPGGAVETVAVIGSGGGECKP